eukprot:CAMPEP_0175067286 /NCGR_PEP_ID=MMETSP0052_2-20121109/17010_1 /TAXON_ID=51329 ORGANISM="Polytomella parva, Strain SAG 63-3" /NCGR_SAMPLE_ID=MMETSP0052_2 /ASSEMBLY_ACC=CAM_ASM_000194 /LENGTH=299 /DNA_ID=CAMNT_0016334143 /DNA_START=41 /DNA_END=936 /DNA_ORIENTATION=-
MSHAKKAAAAIQKVYGAAAPPVNMATWPEVARRHLAAAAAARFLACSVCSRSRGLDDSKVGLPGASSCLSAFDWQQYMVGGINFLSASSSSSFASSSSPKAPLPSRSSLHPPPVSSKAHDPLWALHHASFVPSTASPHAALAVQHREDTLALLASEFFLIDSSSSPASSPLPASSPADVIEAVESDIRVGRRFICNLVVESLKGQSQDMCPPLSFSNELSLGERLGRTSRQLGVHAILDRLDSGFYHATGDWITALLADLVRSMRLWIQENFEGVGAAAEQLISTYFKWMLSKDKKKGG